MKPSLTVAVTGANGLVGSAVCASLSKRGAEVRAVVRRGGSAPTLPGLQEWVGSFEDPVFSAEVVAGADAVVTTVYPVAGGVDTQRRTGLVGTRAFVQSAAAAGVSIAVHISTIAVYDRRPGMGDIDESSPLVGDGAGPYPVIKRDLDIALADIGGLTRVLVRPPAILGPGPTSVWNTLRPSAIRESEDTRRAAPHETFAWVHVDDLASFVADLATGLIEDGPTVGACTSVNVASEPATFRDYVGTVTSALGLEPIWEDAPVWTGQVDSRLAQAWGWRPSVSLAHAMAELAAGLRADGLRLPSGHS